jgi:chemotaxis signal transduction protein
MNMPHQDEPNHGSPSSGTPQLDLSQLLALARARTIDEQSAALEQAHRGVYPVAPPAGEPYLLFTCADVPCAAPLTQFREVLPTLPTTVALPFSPQWVLGFFALHTDLVGLVDPTPFLFADPEMAGISRARIRNGRVIVPGSAALSSDAQRQDVPESGPTALVVGTGERTLALAVSGVGDIAYVAKDEFQMGNIAATSARTPVERFRAGAFVLQESHAAFQVLKVDALLDTLLDALMSVEARSHE